MNASFQSVFPRLTITRPETEAHIGSFSEVRAPRLPSALKQMFRLHN